MLANPLKCSNSASAMIMPQQVCGSAQLIYRHGMFSFNSALELPNCKAVLIAHHDGQLLAGVGTLPLSSSSGIAMHSASHSCCFVVKPSQAEVVLQLVETCR